MANEKDYSRLRKLLNPAIKGPNTDSVLNALASATGPQLIDQITAVNDQMYICSSSGRYLDQRLADYGLSRPPQVGIGDDVYREIGTSVVNQKQIRSLLMEILATIFGEEATVATAHSSAVEPFNLKDGDTLIVGFDGVSNATVVFNSSDFTDINNATAQEVADAISKSLSAQGVIGGAYAQDDGSGPFVVLKSETKGPQSSVVVRGGRSQNELKFPSPRPVLGSATTIWSVTLEAGAIARFTWVGGPDPFLGKARVGDYVNVFGANFDDLNQGTYTITAVQGGLAGDAYFEVQNPNAVPQIVNQGDTDALLFFYPQKIYTNSKFRWAGVYQTSPRLVEIFMPATTKVVKRERIGAMHLRSETDGPGSDFDDYGPYVFDTEQPFVVGSAGGVLSEAISPATGKIINLNDATQFPDSTGHIVIGYGTSRQEGPIPYIARPSSSSLLLNPTYTISKRHPVGEDVSIISRNGPVSLSPIGADYQSYITDEVSGRLYAQELIDTVVATGINVVIHIIYPDDIGLGRFGTEYSDITYVYGE